MIFLFILLQGFFAVDDTLVLYTDPAFMRYENLDSEYRFVDSIMVTRHEPFGIKIEGINNCGGKTLYPEYTEVLCYLGDALLVLSLFIFALTAYGLRWNKNFKPKIK